MTNLTKREKIALFVVVIVLAYSFYNPRFTLGQEYLYLLCVVAPLGFFIATDTERINRKEK